MLVMKAANILLKKLGGLVVRLLKTACYVGWAKLGVGTALEYGLQFWTTYCNALGQLVEPVTKHRRELLKASPSEQAGYLRCTQISLPELDCKSLSR